MTMATLIPIAHIRDDVESLRRLRIRQENHSPNLIFQRITLVSHQDYVRVRETCISIDLSEVESQLQTSHRSVTSQISSFHRQSSPLSFCETILKRSATSHVRYSKPTNNCRLTMSPPSTSSELPTTNSGASWGKLSSVRKLSLSRSRSAFSLAATP